MLPETLGKIWLYHNGDVFHAQCSACNTNITAMNFGVQFNSSSVLCIENISPSCKDCENEHEISCTVIHEYICGNKEKVYQYAEYVDPNYENGHILKIAASNNDNELIKLLLQHRINVDLSGVLGDVALNGNLEAVKLFITAGANPLKLENTVAWSYHKEIKELFETFIRN